jgi:hypothetical protein
MIRHYAIIAPSTAVGRANIYGSGAEFQYFGNVVSVMPTQPLPGTSNVWGMPTQSGNLIPLAAWGVWQTLDPVGTLLSQQGAIGAFPGSFFFTWDDSAESFTAYSTRWRSAAGWTDLPFGMVIAIHV